MTVHINNKKQELPGKPTIVEALTFYRITSFDGVAVAINNEVIAKATWAVHTLNDADNITLIRASQGG